MSKPTIYSTLTADVDVSALVSTRVFPRFIPEGQAVPAVVYQTISRVPVHHMLYAATLDDIRYQVTSWAATDLAAVDLANKVRSAMEGASFRLVLELDQDYELETERHGVRQDYIYQEART